MIWNFRILGLIVGLIFFLGCGRLVKVPEKERMIQQVFKVQLSKDEIYDRALEWCAKKYVSINDAVVVKDREKGKIIGKGMGKYSEYFDFLVDRQFGYTFTIEARENKYRVTFGNYIVYYNEREHRSGPAEYKFEINKINKELGKLFDTIREFVSSGVAGTDKKKEEEW